MAQKLSKKSSTQPKCNKGCKGKILTSGEYCRCIERKLPQLGTHKSISPKYTDSIERFGYTPSYEQVIEADDIDLDQKLEAFGLKKFERDFLVDKFQEGLSFRQIVKERGWISLGSAAHHYRMIIKKLRKGKYS